MRPAGNPKQLAISRPPIAKRRPALLTHRCESAAAFDQHASSVCPMVPLSGRDESGDETSGSAELIVVAPACVGGLNGDRRINPTDLSLLQGDFGTER